MSASPKTAERRCPECTLTKRFPLAWEACSWQCLTARSHDELGKIFREARLKAPQYKPVTYAKGSGNLLELALVDHHFGKLAWAEETGDANYDLKIAERLWNECVEGLLSRLPVVGADKILFVLGNDLLHADNAAGTTTKGTVVDMDCRLPKVFRLVRKVVGATIERLRGLAPVHVLLCPGNHDSLSCWMLGETLQAQFWNTPDVTIDNRPTTRKFVRWGNVLLMFTHGNTGKRSSYPTLMAQEQPKLWGETTWHEVHTGDKHQTRVEEYNGVRVRVLPALCPPDAWHAANHFVGNIRSSEAFVWNKKDGLLGTAIYAPFIDKPGKDR